MKAKSKMLGNPAPKAKPRAKAKEPEKRNIGFAKGKIFQSADCWESDL